jgi:hypothetical protein
VAGDEVSFSAKSPAPDKLDSDDSVASSRFELAPILRREIPKREVKPATGRKRYDQQEVSESNIGNNNASRAKPMVLTINDRIGTTTSALPFFCILRLNLCRSSACRSSGNRSAAVLIIVSTIGSLLISNYLDVQLIIYQHLVVDEQHVVDWHLLRTSSETRINCF